MATWIVVSESDLDDYLVAAQAEAWRTKALGTGQVDPFDNIMTDVAAKVRAAILSCEKNTVDILVNSVPPSLKDTTVYLIVERLANRLNQALTDQQAKAIVRAYDDLERVAKCELTIEKPTTAVSPDPTQSSGGGASTVSKRTREATGSKLKGL